MPTAAEKPKATNTDWISMIIGHPSEEVIAIEPTTPNAIPMRPPMMERVTASMRNWVRMSRPHAPTAILRPKCHGHRTAFQALNDFPAPELFQKHLPWENFYLVFRFAGLWVQRHQYASPNWIFFPESSKSF